MPVRLKIALTIFLTGLLTAVFGLANPGSQQLETNGGGNPVDSTHLRMHQLTIQLEATSKELQALQRSVTTYEVQQQKIRAKVEDQDSLIQLLRSEANALQGKTTLLETDLSAKDQALGGRISTLDQRTGQHWIITLLLVALLVGTLALAFWGLRQLLGKRVGAVGDELARINTDVQAKLLRVDSELLTSLEKLVHAKPVGLAALPAEVEHSLALKVADEVTRIEQNLAQMDVAVKGHKQLVAAVKRMHENLLAAGYQLPQLLGRPYDEGMKLTAAFVPDDSLKMDERVITRVFKPTVLFEGKMVQSGDVQVSQG